MDLLPSIDELRDQLVAHDIAVQEIIALDQYIEQQSEQTFLSNMGDCEVPPFQRLIRISIAEGIKRMFKEYRLQRWLKVQDMANTVRQVLDTEEQVNTEPQDTPVLWQQHQVVPAPTVLERPERRPGSDVWQVSPIQPPLLRLLSPISTPNITNNMESGQVQHSSPLIINRQLFPNAQCPDIVNTSEVQQDIVLYQSNTEVHQTSNITNTAMNTVHENNIMYVPEHLDHQLISQPETQEQIGDNNLYEQDEDMDWDSDYDSSYDDSEENLAGVLFATERLLPEEQAIRLDVEMGDMGVGHVLFDRVSAVWYKYQCTFHRAS